MEQNFTMDELHLIQELVSEFCGNITDGSVIVSSDDYETTRGLFQKLQTYLAPKSRIHNTFPETILEDIPQE